MSHTFRTHLTRLFASTVGLVATGLASGALACSDLPNICELQQQQHQANLDYYATPVWEYEDDDYGYGYGDDDGGDYYGFDASGPAFDPMMAEMQLATGIAMEVAANHLALAQLQADPRYQVYLNGGWDYFQDTQDPQPGEYCVAMFWKGDDVLAVTGPGGGYDGALLLFSSPDIPKPDSVRMVQVTLAQTGEAAQTVRAFNYAPPGHAWGTIALAVPTVQALLDGMLDQHAFELTYEGRTVSQIEWHGGLQAKAVLSECVGRWRG